MGGTVEKGAYVSYPPLPAKPDFDRLRDQEERHLMYACITRARRRLVLVRAWYYRHNIRAKEPAPYWHEPLAARLHALGR